MKAVSDAYPPLMYDDLWRVLEDPDAEPARRGAAAIALNAQLDESARQRVRVAAGTVASPKLRVVLDAVAVGRDDSAVSDALEQLESRRSRVETD